MIGLYWVRTKNLGKTLQLFSSEPAIACHGALGDSWLTAAAEWRNIGLNFRPGPAKGGHSWLAIASLGWLAISQQPLTLTEGVLAVRKALLRSAAAAQLAVEESVARAAEATERAAEAGLTVRKGMRRIVGLRGGR